MKEDKILQQACQIVNDANMVDSTKIFAKILAAFYFSLIKENITSDMARELTNTYLYGMMSGHNTDKREFPSEEKGSLSDEKEKE